MQETRICRIEGCERDEVHSLHAIRAWCNNKTCKNARGVFITPDEHGCVTCQVCAQEMRIRIDEPEKSWVLVVRGAYRRIDDLRAKMPFELVDCPWGQIDGYNCHEGCKCRGTKQVSVAFLMAHYEQVIEDFDCEALHHPLEDCIERAVKTYEPKRFGDLIRDVEADYGAIGPTEETSDRVLHRYLARLVSRGRVIRVGLGNRLFAYLKCGSKLATEISHCREAVIDSCSDAQAHASW